MQLNKRVKKICVYREVSDSKQLEFEDENKNSGFIEKKSRQLYTRGAKTWYPDDDDYCWIVVPFFLFLFCVDQTEIATKQKYSYHIRKKENKQHIHTPYLFVCTLFQEK